MSSPLALLAIFGLSPLEMTVIVVVVLIIFGPKSLPGLGRAMGKGLREFKDASGKFTEALTEETAATPATGRGESAKQLAARESTKPVEAPRVAQPVGTVPQSAPDASPEDAK